MTLTDGQHGAKVDSVIRFKAENVDGKEIQYQYKNTAELERIWRSDDIDMNVPENDAVIYDIEVKGRSDISTTLKFSELLKYLGVSDSVEAPYRIVAGKYVYIYYGHNTDEVANKFRSRYGTSITIDMIEEIIR